jgi:hypothetical protein
MLITAWAITAVILPFAVFQLVYLWPNQSVRLLSVARSLSLLWAIQELWEAQHWYQVAVAWQAAYLRDIGIAQRRCLESSRQFQCLQSIEFVYDGDCCAVDQSHFVKGLIDLPLSPHTSRHDREVLAEFQRNSRDRNADALATSCVFPQVGLHCNLSKNPQSQPQADISAEEILNYQNQSEATPDDWCW